MDLVMQNPDVPWNDMGLSRNPNLSYEDMTGRFKGLRNWDILANPRLTCSQVLNQLQEQNDMRGDTKSALKYGVREILNSKAANERRLINILSIDTQVEQFAREHMAAYRIQKWWLTMFYDPSSPVCRRRLLRDFSEIINSQKTNNI